jgi:hypothetical protein
MILALGAPRGLNRSISQLSLPRQCTEALALLQPVYDRFTDGFDTTDLKAAKTLLDILL